MNTKRVFYTELAYVLGIVILAVGTALMERADFGMSMVVAPAYLVHLAMVRVLPWFSFGVAEYCFQAVLLVVLMLVMRRFQRGYLFSFITAVIYGTVLDLVIKAVGFIPFTGIAAQAVYYVVGLLLCSVGVAMLFHTYISPEAYELFVKEVAAKWRLDISRTKTVYDCVSCMAAVVMSFAIFGFGRFEGVKWGTILCALINGTIIGWCSTWLNAHFEFRDGMKLRPLFES